MKGRQKSRGLGGTEDDGRVEVGRVREPKVLAFWGGFPGLLGRGGWKCWGDTSDSVSWNSLKKVPEAKDNAALSKYAAAVKPQETLHPPNQAKCYTKAPPDQTVQERGGGSSHTTEEPMKLPEVRDLGSV